MSNENIFSRFWHHINKILVPRNARVEETSSNFVVTLQNAKGETKEEREDLVTFSIPKGTSYTEQDRDKVDFLYDKIGNIENITEEQWATMGQVNSFSGQINTLNSNLATISANLGTLSATVSANSNNISALQNSTDKTVTANYAATNSAGYMSAADKKSFDTIKAYSDKYAVFWADKNITQVAVPRDKQVNYVFRMNQNSFNSNVAECYRKETGTGQYDCIRIKEPGQYLVLGSAAMKQTVTQENGFTLRLIQSRNNFPTPATVSGGVVTGGINRGSFNTYVKNSGYYNTGTVFNILDLKENDLLFLAGCMGRTVTSGVWIHPNTKLVLFKMLSDNLGGNDQADQDQPDPES